jgi:hypothetical protein
MSNRELDKAPEACGCASSRVDEAADRLYCAEVALHAARSSHVDAWINAAYENLHVAVAAHLTAITEVAS